MAGTVIIKDRGLFGTTSVDNRFISELIADAPGDAVKVYLYGLMLLSENGSDAADIADGLKLTEEQVDDAFRYWEKVGLIRIASGENGNLAVQYLPVRGERSTAEAEAARSMRYAPLIGKLQAILGTRNLTGSELQRIYDWIEVFRFEEDAAAEIVSHCISVKGARVHINYMDSVAKRLAADGIVTADAVKASFLQETELSGGAANILKRWRISRRPTEDELRLYEKWTHEWGFSPDAISIALSDVVAIDRPNFKYLDAILSGYRENGSITPEKMHELIREQDMIAELARQAFSRAGMKRGASAADRRQFEFWFREYGMSAELILFAAELASKKSTPFAEMKKLITDWHERGIASYEAAKDDAEKRKAEADKAPFKGKSVNRALNYKQRQYTAEDLKKFGIDLGEDVYNED
ncbi:MAG: DnaD domain protein [Clostridia bacterium]|nr:DnaD domain protein [Clostridia bacterium]MBR6007002.1 DnaD domain protein [Clostridia bacterium]